MWPFFHRISQICFPEISKMDSGKPGLVVFTNPDFFWRRECLKSEKNLKTSLIFGVNIIKLYNFNFQNLWPAKRIIRQM